MPAGDLVREAALDRVWSRQYHRAEQLDGFWLGGFTVEQPGERQHGENEAQAEIVHHWQDHVGQDFGHADIERARVSAQPFVPLSSAPGESYQFDWSHETITRRGLPLKRSSLARRFATKPLRNPGRRAPTRLQQGLTNDARAATTEGTN